MNQYQELVTKHFSKIEWSMFVSAVVMFVGMFMHNDVILNLGFGAAMLIGLVTLMIINGPNLMEELRNNMKSLSVKENKDDTQK